MLRAAVGERRILINALSWSFGGGNTYSLNLIRELSRDPRGFRFTVLGAPGRLPADESGGLDVARVRLPAGRAQASTLFRVAYEETLLPLRARRFDLLYCMADLAPAFRQLYAKSGKRRQRQSVRQSVRQSAHPPPALR